MHMVKVRGDFSKNWASSGPRKKAVELVDEKVKPLKTKERAVGKTPTNTWTSFLRLLAGLFPHSFNRFCGRGEEKSEGEHGELHRRETVSIDP